MRLQHFVRRLLTRRSFLPGERVRMNPVLWIIFALMVLILPLRWIFAVFFAAAFHELCHGIMIYLCGSRILSAEVGDSGIILETEPMRPAAELLCALAGPVGGLLLLPLVRWFPRIAICAAIQSLYNLLPVYPLDGGRALRCVLGFFFPPATVCRLCLWAERICFAGILCLGLYGTLVLKLGGMPLIYGCLVLYQLSKRKIPCKPGRQRVQ